MTTKNKQQVPSIGDTVEIAIKPYKGKTEKGIIKKILTKKKYHSRGHKVMLHSGTIGRIIKIIKNKKIDKYFIYKYKKQIIISYKLIKY